MKRKRQSGAGAYGTYRKLGTTNVKRYTARRLNAGPVRAGAPGTALATRGFAGSYGSSANEKKVSDITTATYGVNTTGSFTLLHIPVLGSDYTQRIGRKTVAKSIYLRGRVQIENANNLSTTATAIAQQARMILFVDLQPNGAVPAVLDLLNTATPDSHLNLNNRDRFRILKDKEYVFDPMQIINTATQATAVMNHTVSNVKCFKKINIETIFNATNGGNIADINSGAIYMFWIGSVAAGTNTDGFAIISTRVRYIDS